MFSRTEIKNAYFEQRLTRNRAVVAALFCVLLIGLLLGRVLFLQVGAHEHFSTLSDNNRIRLMSLPPTRGLIYDRNGVTLAENRPSYQLSLVREEVPDLEATLAGLQDLIAISDLDRERFQKSLRRSKRFEPVPLKLNLSEAEVARFAANRHRFPGVDIEARLVRHYPQQGLAVHAVGYVGRINERELRTLDETNYRSTTHIGKVGVEKYYEQRLHGQVGYQQVEVDAQGRIVRVLEEVPPVPGEDIRLSLDAELQRVAETALEDYSGAIIALEPRTGEVLAFVSKPTYDPNLFVNGISREDYQGLSHDRDRPLFNRALAGQYPPGSTIKPLMGLAGVEYGLIDPAKRFFAGPYYQLPNDDHRYRDWKKWGHGWVNLDRAIAQSCDVYFYDLAYRLGIDRMHDFLGRFGLGRKTGIDLPGEVSGLLPSREWKRRVKSQPWYPGETLIAGIGQGYMLSTPLQLASLTATVGMEGQRVVPRLLLDDERALPAEAVRLHDPGNWQHAIEPMHHVVHSVHGTASKLAPGLGYEMAGKSGTAQVFSLGQDEEYDEEEIAKRLRDHALFIAFAPLEAPQIAVAVIVENGGSGSSVAGPMARKVIDHYLMGEAAL